MGDRRKNTLETLKIQGKVKRIKESYFEAIEQIGSIVMGNPKRKGTGGLQYDSFEMIFNGDGNKVEDIWTNSDGLNIRLVYKYDNYGRRIEGDKFTMGYVDTKITYSYDEQGNEIEVNNFTPNGERSMKLIYKYDSNGNAIEEYCYFTDDHVQYKWDSIYDDKGNKIEQIGYNSEGQIISKKENKFDLDGNHFRTKYYNPDDSLKLKERYEFEFDENGNWIKQIIFFNDEPSLMVKRAIEYFD